MASIFENLDEYIGATRMSGLTLSPDGARLVVTASVLDDKSTKFVSSLWEVDPTGGEPARRLTWGERGESGATFAGTGDLLFIRRSGSADDAPATLWMLPVAGGEGQEIGVRAADISGIRAARAADTFVVSAPVFGTADDDERIRTERKDKSVSAILHTGYPVRYWDHDLGPDAPQYFSGTLAGDREPLRCVTTAPGRALRESQYDISSDGTFMVTTWIVPTPLTAQRTTLVRIDLALGTTETIVDDLDADAGSPVISPDGSSVVFVRETVTTPEQSPRMTLHQYTFDTATATDIAPDWDRWPSSVAWLPDGTGLLVTADDLGRSPIFSVVQGAEPVRLTMDDAAYTNLQVAPDGASVYAIRASYAQAPHPVRVDIASGAVTELLAPAASLELPGTLVDISAPAQDGVQIRAWLALPHGASEDNPAPLLLWVHGGPLSSWNTWSWRWNPWLLVAQGYAVLLPDPALSTGYGQEFVQRGWGQWGKAPYTDLMSITDAAVARLDIDESQTGAMGGSFGGYMANWIAGHTNRFDAIVTHASLWALDQFGPTTDAAFYWQREMTPEMAVENSPHLFVSDISTPMLVIHGDKDYRVPIGEGLRLWYELLAESGLPADDNGVTDHRFLYFPTENHWVLSPQHAKVWYEVVFAFLAEHVLREDPEVSGSHTII